MSGPATKLRPSDLPAKKSRGEKIIALTAYDYVMARLVDAAGVDMILVGDSLGNVVLGYPDTTHVTLGDMLHHLRAVVRARPAAVVAVDMPVGTYADPDSALRNARALVDAGAEAVKLEGGIEISETVRALVSSGIPVIGHIGMLPQQVHRDGGYKIKGKTEAERQWLLESAQALAAAGVIAIVLELVVPELAAEITRRVPVPTIGIGAGPDCDGQILVTYDLVGLMPWLKLRHVTPLANAGEQIIAAIRQWKSTVVGVRR